MDATNRLTNLHGFAQIQTELCYLGCLDVFRSPSPRTQFSLGQVLDASCDFPSTEPELAPTAPEPPTQPLERRGEVPVSPPAVALAKFLQDGDDRLACPTALPAPAPRNPRNQPAPITPVTPSHPPTWSPTVEMGIPPPPAIPPPQPQDLDLTERLSGFRTGPDAFETPNRATPAASSVAAQLFSMPAVVPDHTKMFDELGVLATGMGRAWMDQRCAYLCALQIVDNSLAKFAESSTTNSHPLANPWL